MYHRCPQPNAINPDKGALVYQAWPAKLRMKSGGYVPHRLPNLIATIMLVAASSALLVTSGCRRPVSTTSKTSSTQTRQASADADRKEELKFQDEQGNTDWRGRIEAAKESLEQAKSDKRWGKREAALEHALDAARLMPPPGKDFSLPPLTAGDSKDSEKSADMDSAESDSDQNKSSDQQNEFVGRTKRFGGNFCNKRRSPKSCERCLKDCWNRLTVASVCLANCGLTGISSKSNELRQLVTNALSIATVSGHRRIAARNIGST